MKLYLNDLGIVCALGAGKRRVLDGLLAGDTSGMQGTGPLLTGRHSLCGVVSTQLTGIPEALAEFDCRNNRLLATAIFQIEPAIRQAVDAHGRSRIATVIGTSTSGIAARESSYGRLETNGDAAEAFHYRQQEIGTAAEFLARRLELMGPRYTISTACSSSAKAVAAAARLIRSNRCDAAIVGGSDSLCKLTLNGFDALESLAPSRCNPFSRNRRGINIGEAACVFLLSKRKTGVALLGSGESSDAYHMAAPHPDGRGAETAIRDALASAQLRPSDVGYVNLHGTATPKNDEMEGKVIHRIFGSRVPCSSTKPQTGHTLGAAGALELGLCWLMLGELNTDRALPPHLWDEEPDDAIPELNLVDGDMQWQKGICLSNTFGFGGSNASLVLGTAR